MFPGLRMPKGDFLRETFMKNYEFWFIVGSQTLYGPEVLETVKGDGGLSDGKAAISSGIQGNRQIR